MLCLKFFTSKLFLWRNKIFGFNRKICFQNLYPVINFEHCYFSAISELFQLFFTSAILGTKVVSRCCFAEILQGRLLWNIIAQYFQFPDWVSKEGNITKLLDRNKFVVIVKPLSSLNGQGSLSWRLNNIFFFQIMVVVTAATYYSPK